MPTTGPKYELMSDDHREMSGGPAFRVRALRAIPRHNVNVGDLGGYVQGFHNLSQDNSAWVASEAVVTERARVDGDALAAERSHLTGDARLLGEAVVTGGVYMAGRAVVTDRARVAAGTSVEGQVLIGGDVVIRHALHLSGDAIYRRQEDLPWSLRTADPAEPGYDAHAREAVELDPAFHRAFAALGATSPHARLAALDQLLADPDGRKAFASISRSIGGVFQRDAYLPRSSTDLAYDQAYRLRGEAALAQVTGFRVLRSIDTENVRESWSKHEGERGSKLHAAVVEAHLPDPDTGAPRVLYQAAAFYDVNPEQPMLSPLGGIVRIYSDAFETWLQAARQSEVMAREEAEWPPRKSLTASPASERVPVSLNHLPLLVHASEVEGAATPRTRFALQQTIASGGISQNFRREPTRYTVIEVSRIHEGARPDGLLDLEKATRHMAFHATPEDAKRQVTPIYADKGDMLTRLRADMDAHTDPALSSLRSTSSAVLVQVLDPTVVEVENQEDRRRLSYRALKAALPPLDWRPVRDPRDPFRFLEGVREADSLNARLTVEQDGPVWTLHVENPLANSIGDKPLHRVDELPDMEAAFEEAEEYRVGLIARELGLPEVGLAQKLQSEDGDVSLPAVFEVRQDGASSYRAGVLRLEDGKLRASTTLNHHATQADAAKAAMAQFVQPPLGYRPDGEVPQPKPAPNGVLTFNL